jgi:hypothetical protein
MALLERIRWFNAIVLTLTPALALYGCFTAQLQSRTLALCSGYYVFGMLGQCVKYRLYCETDSS